MNLVERIARRIYGLDEEPACPDLPATPDMPRLVHLDATPDHDEEHPAYAAGGFIPAPPAATADRVPAWFSAHPPAFPADPAHDCPGCGCTCHPEPEGARS